MALGVYLVRPGAQMGQCVYVRKLTQIGPPVCIDFSPSSEMLVVGMATSRMPLEPMDLPFAFMERLRPQEPTPIGKRLFHYIYA